MGVDKPRQLSSWRCEVVMGSKEMVDELIRYFASAFMMEDTSSITELSRGAEINVLTVKKFLLAEKLQNLIEFNGSSAEELLTHLENATWENLNRNINRASFEAGQEWSLVPQFCKLHGISLSLAYLQECAREDEWLQFVIFAQLHNYQPDKQTSPEIEM
eukprot:g39040.t1